MAVTAIAMPNRPPREKAQMIPAMMTIAGPAVDFERYRESLDHVGAVPRHRRLGDRPHRSEARAGIVLGDHDDEGGHREADESAPEERARSECLPGIGAEIAPKPPNIKILMMAIATIDRSPVTMSPL